MEQLCPSLQVQFHHGGITGSRVEVDGVKYAKTYDASCVPLTSLVFGGVRPEDKQDVSAILVRVCVCVLPPCVPS